ncbi:cysteine methyltransferase [Mycetocola tolaasinivorans]|uniref:Cysteine methyltransferase n=1 Tax=Mycetocola tolaasinivorans TaxID=76635 RepID=A0A3L7AAS2_9MICO|nr:cysteine methyltransferase [Mycetocola tolaasinivorans]
MPEITDAEAFLEGVYVVALAIPAGRVMSYGGIAAALGTRAARQVGKILASQGDDLPWWRVVRADGTLPAELQARARSHWLSEGTPVRGTGADTRPAAAAFLRPQKNALRPGDRPVESGPPNGEHGNPLR